MTAATTWDFASIEEKLDFAQDNFQTIVSPYAWSQKTITFSFPAAAFPGTGSYVPAGESLKYTPFTQSEIDIALKAFDVLERFVDIDFVYDSTGNGDMKIGHQNMTAGGYAQYPYTGSNHAVLVSDSQVVENTGYGIQTLIHEVGHALGLEHPHESNTPLDTDLDLNTSSIMSYDRLATNGTEAHILNSFMPMDIIALQSLYGVSSKISDDVYSADNSISVIADYGGFDSIDISTQSYDAKDINIIDLQRGFVCYDKLNGSWQSTIYDEETAQWTSWVKRNADNGFYNMIIMPGSTIEKVVGSAVADQIIGDVLDNMLAGGLGKDVLTGKAGADNFGFASAGDAGKGKRCDIITDFVVGEDAIDLSAIIADGAFSFIGRSGFHGVDGELRAVMDNNRGTAKDVTYVQGDIDGNGKLDFLIKLTGLHTLQDTDFAL